MPETFSHNEDHDENVDQQRAIDNALERMFSIASSGTLRDEDLQELGLFAPGQTREQWLEVEMGVGKDQRDQLLAAVVERLPVSINYVPTARDEFLTLFTAEDFKLLQLINLAQGDAEILQALREESGIGEINLDIFKNAQSLQAGHERSLDPATVPQDIQFLENLGNETFFTLNGATGWLFALEIPASHNPVKPTFTRRPSLLEKSVVVTDWEKNIEIGEKVLKNPALLRLLAARELIQRQMARFQELNKKIYIALERKRFAAYDVVDQKNRNLQVHAIDLLAKEVKTGSRTLVHITRNTLDEWAVNDGDLKPEETPEQVQSRMQSFTVREAAGKPGVIEFSWTEREVVSSEDNEGTLVFTEADVPKTVHVWLNEQKEIQIEVPAEHSTRDAEKDQEIARTVAYFIADIVATTDEEEMKRSSFAELKSGTIPTADESLPSTIQDLFKSLRYAPANKHLKAEFLLFDPETTTFENALSPVTTSGRMNPSESGSHETPEQAQQLADVRKRLRLIAGLDTVPAGVRPELN